MKDAVIAKIAMQCSCYYAEALKLLQLYSVANVWPKVSYGHYVMILDMVIHLMLNQFVFVGLNSGFIFY